MLDQSLLHQKNVITKYKKTKDKKLKVCRPKHAKLSRLMHSLSSGLLGHMAAGIMLGSALLAGAGSATAFTPNVGVSSAQSMYGSPSGRVRLPNAEYTESMVDMSVKVLGGEVRLNRTWLNGSWHINPVWDQLIFGFDKLDDSVSAINRSGAVYERSGNTNLYVFEHVYIEKTDTGWRWYDREGNWITYNEKGRVTAYGDRNDVSVNFVLDAKGRRLGINDHFGNTVFTFAYDSNEHLIMAQDSEGRKTIYTWEGHRLIAVTDVEGNIWQYTYEKNGQIASRIDPDGGMTMIGYVFTSPAWLGTLMNSGSYDLDEIKQEGGVLHSATLVGASANISTFSGTVLHPNGSSRKKPEYQPPRVGLITYPNGAATLINTDYNKSTKEYTITTINELGRTESSRYNVKGELLWRSVNGERDMVIERDGSYRTSTTNERGLTTIVDRNDARKPTRIELPDGSVTIYTYDSNFNQPLSMTDAMGTVTQWTYDDKGNATMKIEAVGKPEERVTSWTHDNYGQVMSYAIGDATGSSTYSFIYDNKGNLISLTDANGYATEYTHNIQGLEASIINSLENQIVLNYNNKGYLQSAADPLGNKMQYQTDAHGYIVQVTNELGQSSFINYAFTDKGRMLTYTNALGEKIIYSFNSVGNLVSTALPSGAMIQQIYGLEGRVQQQIDFVANVTSFNYGTQGSGFESLLTSTQSPTLKETYAYDALGQTIQESQWLDDETALTTQYRYNALGLPVSVTLPDGRIEQVGYDALGREIRYTDALGAETVQTWNALNQITSITDALGNKHQFEYDPNGNLVKEITPGGETTLYTYDAVNQLIQKVDAIGNVTAFTYDAAGRLVQEVYTAFGSVTPERTIDYVYNAANQLIELSQVGSNTIATRHVYTLDALGRKTQEIVTYGTGSGAISQTIKYSYTVDGELASVTYPGGQTQSYAYQHGQLSGITLPNGEEMTIGDYDWMQPTSVQAPGVTQIFDYDALQRLQNIDAKSTVGTGSGTDSGTDSNTQLVNTSYTYDAVGNIILRHTKDGKYTYGYDAASRLTQVEPPETLQQAGLPQEAYAYDAVGNRIGSAQQPGDWQYNANNQLLIYGEGADKTVYTYTPNGHVATQTKNGQTLTYHYDASDRLVRITSITNAQATAVEVASYAYDAFGRRIAKTINGETTYFLYTEEGLIAELDDAGNTRVAYGWQPDTMYGTAPLWQANIATGKTLQTADYHYIITDHLGTPIMTVNKDGEVTWQALTEAFGKTMPNAQNQITMNLRFPGQYYDQETGTHYNYFRDYNPQTGRYIQRDPIGLNGGINTYGYVRSNSFRNYDPYGLWSASEQWRRYGDSLDWAYRESGAFDAMERSGINDIITNERFVNSMAGFGDVLTVGVTSIMRDRYNVGNVNVCSDEYFYGSVVGFTIGFARLGYAGLAKAGSIFARTGAQASRFRERLKVWFRLGIGRNWRKVDVSTKTAEQLRRSAGRTNVPINTWGLGMAVIGGEALMNDCECNN